VPILLPFTALSRKLLFLMARVLLDHIRKVYDNGYEAVQDASFEIADGEFVVLVGPSGCGKSTTLRMIAGLESISSGDLVIGDRRMNDVEPKDRDIAMVFQNYALYPHMSIYDNMAFGLKLRKFDKAEIDQRVRQAATILGLDKVLDRKPKELSGGQRQRVAVGRAIVRKPQVFLFDEPLSNLDAKLRVQMRTEISKLHRQLGATMVYVTHDQVEAMTMGDRIVVMKDGVIQQIDRPLHLYDHPANRFVAGFIGSPAMNFVDGTLQNERTFVADAGFELPIPEGIGAGTTPGVRVVAGVRPEHLALSPFFEDQPGIPAEVELAEPMGNEVVLYAKAGPQSLVARVDPQPVKSGDAVMLYAQPDKLHLFNAETEESLTAQPEAVA